MKFALALLLVFGTNIAYAQDWVSLARHLATSDHSADLNVSMRNLDGQNLRLFTAVEELMDAVAGTKDLSFSQDLQSAAVSGLQTIADPILLYRSLPVSRPLAKDLGDINAQLVIVLSAIAKVTLPEPLNSKSSVWIRFENALRKLHIAKLIKRGQQSGASSPTMDFLELLRTQAEQSRLQNPHRLMPELDRADRRAVSIILGGFLWRFRGAGGYDDFGTQERRELFVRQGFQALARLNGASEFVADAIGSSLKWGVQLTSWGAYHDMGRLPGDSKYADFIQMESLGRGMTGYTKRVMNFAGLKNTVLITVAGAGMASCYYDAWERIPHNLQVGVKLPKPLLFIFGGPTNWGEFCTGASLGLALSQILQH